MGFQKVENIAIGQNAAISMEYIDYKHRLQFP